jgi:hypothetical protein
MLNELYKTNDLLEDKAAASVDKSYDDDLSLIQALI